MKLLAVFGLALTVAAVDKLAFDVTATGKSTSGHLELPMWEPKDLLELFKADPNNPVYCSEVHSMVEEGKISLAANPEVIFPLIRYCLETGKVLTPEKPLEMRMVHVAAFIFMFRVRGDEGKANDLYNAVMNEHFPAEFKAGLHEEHYTLDALEDFEMLTKEPKKQFFMLRTVKKYGKSSESNGVSQKAWLEYADLAALALVNMGVPLKVLIAGIIALEKELSVGTAYDSLRSLRLVFISLTRDNCLQLEEPEKALLYAFLEKYFNYVWRGHDLLTERLSGKEFVQFQKELVQLEETFESEDEFRYKYLNSGTITRFAGYFRNFTQAGCPVFLLKEMFDFYLEQLPSVKKQLPSAKKEVLDKRHCFLVALDKALKMVEEVVRDKTAKKEKCLHEELVCSQIGSTIKVCTEEINAFSRRNPEIKGPTPA